MKKLSAVVLALLMLLAFTACGGSGDSDTKKVYKVGICQWTQHNALDQATQGFKDALIKELGEENIEFMDQNASGDAGICTNIISGFISNNVDLILANATSALQSAVSATATIPILGTSITEYGVALEIDNFSGTVGGNVSGTSDLTTLTQQAQMIMDLVPDAKNVGVIYCTSEPNSAYQVKVVKEYLENKGLKVTEYSFAETNDLAAVTSSAVETSDVIYTPTDNTVALAGAVIDGICRPAKVPVVTSDTGTCKLAGIAALAISYYDLGYKTGEMAAQVLTGEADISTMPIQYDEDIVPVYNEEICNELGITVPDNYQPLK